MRHALAAAVLASTALSARAAVFVAPSAPAVSAPAVFAAAAAPALTMSPAAMSATMVPFLSAPALAPAASLAAPSLILTAAAPAAAPAAAVPAAALPSLNALAAPADGPVAPDAGRLAFDGAARAAASDGPAPAPTPAPEIKPEAARAALGASLGIYVAPAVIGWRAPHVEKASFPYQVDRQARIWGPQARARIDENHARVTSMIPSLAQGLLIDLKTRLGAPAGAAAPDATLQMLFMRLLLEAANSGSIFSTHGTVVNVGWGSGDHVNVTGSVAASGGSVANSLAYAATQRLFSADPVYAPLRAWLNAR